MPAVGLGVFADAVAHSNVAHQCNQSTVPQAWKWGLKSIWLEVDVRP